MTKSAKRPATNRPAPKRQYPKSQYSRRQYSRRPGASRWLFPAVLGVVVIAGVVAVVLASSGDGDGGGPSASSTAHEIGPDVTVGGGALVELPESGTDPAVGEDAPSISGEDFAGDPVTFANDGRPRVLVFLAHWCPHCQAEVPVIVDLAESGDIPEGLEIQGIATSTTDEQPNYPPSAWLDREGWPFPVLADDAAYTAAATYGLTSFPYFVFVGADGTVAGRVSGEIPGETLVSLFQDLVAGKALPSMVPSG